MNEQAINALREAIRLSPDNVTLRQCLGDLLLAMLRYDEAAQEFRQALTYAPNDVSLKLRLATAFLWLNKNTQALVIVEDLLKRSDTPAQAYILHAHLLLRTGEVERAVRQYREAINLDPSISDPDLAGRLGIGFNEDTGEVVDGKVRAAWEDGPSITQDSIERPRITFSEVGGMDAVKDEIRMKIIHPLTHPELYRAYGKTIGGGILLYGPPGCGKTYLARATAGEVQASFLVVGINEVLEMWIGQSERNPARDLRTRSRESPLCALLRRGRCARRQSIGSAAKRRPTTDQSIPLRTRWREQRQRGNPDPRCDQRSLASRPGLSPAGEVRSHPVRAAARRACPPVFSASSWSASPPRTSISISWPGRPTVSSEPTSRRSSMSPSNRNCAKP